MTRYTVHAFSNTAAATTRFMTPLLILLFQYICFFTTDYPTRTNCIFCHGFAHKITTTIPFLSKSSCLVNHYHSIHSDERNCFYSYFYDVRTRYQSTTLLQVGTDESRETRTTNLGFDNIEPISSTIDDDDDDDDVFSNQLNRRNTGNIIAFDALAKSCAMCLLQQLGTNGATEENDKTTTSLSSSKKLIPVSEILQNIKMGNRKIVPKHGDGGQQRRVQVTALSSSSYSDWRRWFQSIPTPTIIDWSSEFQNSVQKQLDTIQILQKENIHTKYHTFIDVKTTSRIIMRMILIPSGYTLSSPLQESPGSMIHTKVLHGDVLYHTHYVLPEDESARVRGLGMPESSMKETTTTVRRMSGNSNEDSQYGIIGQGHDRMYEAFDLGPVSILEVIVLPLKSNRDQRKPNDGNIVLSRDFSTGQNMVVTGLNVRPKHLFDYIRPELLKNDGTNTSSTHELIEKNNDDYATLWGIDRNQAFRTTFKSAVGGLQPQIDAIVRRVLDGRIIRPADDDNDDAADIDSQSRLKTSSSLQRTTKNKSSSSTSLEAKELELLGLTPIRGLLLYGPPGCGKTALAREISKALRARAPKIVSAPELLDRWVGGSEKLVRALFVDAEAELALCGGDATRSALHVIVIDEIDAVFRKRTSSEDSGEATRSSVVNQILTKLDGVYAIPNVLLIGMTNRKELLDEALLRPGRLEVQIEVPMPNQQGRREILNIHFDSLRRKGRLSVDLCCAIDGIPVPRVVPNNNDNNVDGNWSASTPVLHSPVWNSKQALQKVGMFLFPKLRKKTSVYDIASDSVTGGFSGADIAGLVRCAGSIALSRARKDGTGIAGLFVTLSDVQRALVEVKRG